MYLIYASRHRSVNPIPTGFLETLSRYFASLPKSDSNSITRVNLTTLLNVT